MIHVISFFWSVCEEHRFANLEAIRAWVRPARVMPILKANAYGHGLAEVAKFLSPMVDYIGVAVLEEGIFLRRLGVQAPILVLGGIWGDQIPKYLEYDLTLTAPSVERLEQIDAVARQMGVRARVHLKIDTGMGRMGLWHEEAAAAVREIKALHGLLITGFASEVPGLYSEEARARGYIEAPSRRGEPTRYPLMTVSIGGVNTAFRPITSYLQLTEIAAEVKGYAKDLEGNQFVMDRRRG